MKALIDNQFDHFNALIEQLKKVEGSFAIIFFFLFILPFVIGALLKALN